MRQSGTSAGRWGRVEDVSLSALYMCSPAASWITATQLTVDGGQTHGARGIVEMKNAIDAKSNREKAAFSETVRENVNCARRNARRLMPGGLCPNTSTADLWAELPG